MITVYAFLIAEWVALLLLTGYLSRVLPSDYGTRSHPLFCLPRALKRALGVNDGHRANSEREENEGAGASAGR